MSDQPTTAIPLWQQLQAVAQALAQVRRGVSGTAALEAVPSALRPGVQALLFQVLRQLGRAQALRAQLAQRAPAPLPDALLCTAGQRLVDSDSESVRCCQCQRRHSAHNSRRLAAGSY